LPWSFDVYQSRYSLLAAPLAGDTLSNRLSNDFNEDIVESVPREIQPPQYCGHTYGHTAANGELSEIVYTRPYVIADPQYPTKHAGELFAVRVDGTGWRRLRQQQPSYLLHNDLCVGVASNDWLVFRRDIPATTSLAGSTPPTTELYALRTDGSGEEHLLVDGGSFTYEGSSPAQRIVYPSRVGPTKTLYSVNVDGTHAKEIYSQTGPGFAGVSGFTSQNRAIVNMGGEGLVGIDVFDGNRSSLSEGLVSVRVLGILCPARFGKRTPCGMNWQLVEPAYFFE